MYFELTRGTDCRRLAGLCQGALYQSTTCGAPQVVKTGNPTGDIMFAMLIKVIVISKMQMFCGLNKNNDPFGYLLLHVDAKMTHLDTYQ